MEKDDKIKRNQSNFRSTAYHLSYDLMPEKNEIALLLMDY
jgi:hypothetical protein